MRRPESGWERVNWAQLDRHFAVSSGLFLYIGWQVGQSPDDSFASRCSDAEASRGLVPGLNNYGFLYSAGLRGDLSQLRPRSGKGKTMLQLYARI